MTPLDLQWLLDKACKGSSERKALLFAVACCRRLSFLMSEDQCQKMLEMADNLGLLDLIESRSPIRPDFLLQTVEAIERRAEGAISAEDLEEASEAADILYRVIDNYYACYDDSWGPVDEGLLATCEVAGAVHEASAKRYSAIQVANHAMNVATHARYAVSRARGGTEADQDPAELAAQCELVREIFSCPPHLGTDPAWQTSTNQGLAKSIYEDRTFDLLPILGDALEDVGADAAILEHLRSPGPHVRGCWALDLVLGKR